MIAFSASPPFLPSTGPRSTHFLSIASNCCFAVAGIGVIVTSVNSGSPVRAGRPSSASIRRNASLTEPAVIGADGPDRGAEASKPAAGKRRRMFTAVRLSALGSRSLRVRSSSITTSGVSQAPSGVAL
jgi:hypothetical protein